MYDVTNNQGWLGPSTRYSVWDSWVELGLWWCMLRQTSLLHEANTETWCRAGPRFAASADHSSCFCVSIWLRDYSQTENASVIHMRLSQTNWWKSWNVCIFLTITIYKVQFELETTLLHFSKTLSATVFPRRMLLSTTKWVYHLSNLT